MDGGQTYRQRSDMRIKVRHTDAGQTYIRCNKQVTVIYLPMNLVLFLFRDMSCQGNRIRITQFYLLLTPLGGNSIITPNYTPHRLECLFLPKLYPPPPCNY